jgi:hypothetical protein
LVLRSLHASLAYLHMSTFDQLERLPLKVCKGDLGLHIAELASLDQDAADRLDVFSRKLWWLAQDGFSLSQFEEGIALLREAAFTTNTVEQNHRHAAMLTKLHSLYEEDTLRYHSLLAQARDLVGLSRHEQLKARLQARLSKLLDKQPENAHGFLEFKRSSEAALLIDEDADSGDDDGSPLARTQARTRKFAAAWRTLAPQRRAAMEALARARSVLEKERIRQGSNEIMDALSLSECREQQERRYSGLFYLFAPRWSPAH